MLAGLGVNSPGFLRALAAGTAAAHAWAPRPAPPSTAPAHAWPGT